MVRRIGLVAMLAVCATLVLTTSAYAGRRGCGGGHGHRARGHRGHRGHGCCGAVSHCGSCGGCVSTCGSGCGGCVAEGPVVAGAAYAALIVNVPEGATLAVDGQNVAIVGGSQVFYTPDIQPNQDYHYNLTLRVTRDGQTSDVTRTVVVRAGEQSQVDFDSPVAVSETE
jgi:uncharacterized protein (TIGR03000 family)